MGVEVETFRDFGVGTLEPATVVGFRAWRGERVGREEPEWVTERWEGGRAEEGEFVLLVDLRVFGIGSEGSGTVGGPIDGRGSVVVAMSTKDYGLQLREVHGWVPQAGDVARDPTPSSFT